MKNLILISVMALLLTGCFTVDNKQINNNEMPMPENKKSDMTLIEDSKTGNLEEVKKLINAGADVNANKAGWTALQWASEKGNTEVIELLKQAGAK